MHLEERYMIEDRNTNGDLKIYRLIDVSIQLKKIFLVIFLFFTISCAVAQEKEGYFGAKNFVTVESLVYSPLIYNLRNDSYDNSKYDQNLNPASDNFNGGFRASFGRIIERNFALCLEAGVDFSNIYAGVQQSVLGSQYLDFHISKLNIQTYSILPKIEFATTNSLLPLGFSHQIGVGFSNSKLVNKDYNYISGGTYDYYGTGVLINNEEYIKTHLYDYTSAKSIKMYTFLYALSMRVAISKNLLFNYGFRYTLHVKNDKYFQQDSPDYLLQLTDMKERVYKQSTSNLITLNFGLTYAF